MFIIICLSFLVFPKVAKAYEYSVRTAFCRDYANSKSSVYSSTYNYDWQRSYNLCIKNADSFIDAYHLKQQKQKQDAIQRRRQAELDRQRMIENTKKFNEQERQRQEKRINDALDGFR